MQLLLSCIGQFELAVGGMGGVMHLEARAVNVERHMDWLRIRRRRRPQVWAQYRVMERAALQVLNARAAAEAKKATDKARLH